MKKVAGRQQQAVQGKQCRASSAGRAVQGEQCRASSAGRAAQGEQCRASSAGREHEVVQKMSMLDAAAGFTGRVHTPSVDSEAQLYWTAQVVARGGCATSYLEGAIAISSSLPPSSLLQATCTATTTTVLPGPT